MRLFLIAGLSFLATQASAEPKFQKELEARPKAECKKTTAHLARRGGPLKPEKLKDLPPADMYAAMYRTVNGCEEPLILTRAPKSR
jgi:hypothetical protein